MAGYQILRTEFQCRPDLSQLVLEGEFKCLRQLLLAVAQ